MEKAIEILPTDPDTATFASINAMVHVMNSMIGQTSANDVDIDTTVSFHQKPISLWKL